MSVQNFIAIHPIVVEYFSPVQVVDQPTDQHYHPQKHSAIMAKNGFVNGGLAWQATLSLIDLNISQNREGSMTEITVGLNIDCSFGCYMHF